MIAVLDTGPRPHPRTLGWIGTTALAMGGSNQSLFLLGALVASQGSAAIPLLIVGLLLSWAAAFGWTELVLMFPDRVGGIAASCAEAFRPYSPVLSTLTGVCYWWGWVPTCGLTAILSASAITQWYLPDVPVPALAIGLVTVFTLVNLAGVRWVTRLAVPIAIVSAALALVSGLAPVLAGTVDWHLAASFHLVSPFAGIFGDLTSAMAGLYLIGFAAPAFEAAACHVGETVDPERNVPRAMLASGAMAAVYFVLLPVIWLGVLGPEALQDDLAQVLGPTFAPVFGTTARAAAIGFMMLNMFHGTLQPLAGASRTLMQLAEDGLLPRMLALRSRLDVPWVATLLTAVVAIAFLLAGDPTWLIAAANLAYLIGIGLPSVAVWLLRRDAPHLLRPYRAPRGTIQLGLLAALAWGISCLLGFEQFGLPTVIVGLLLCYSGAGFYAFRRLSDRRRAGLPGVQASLHLKLTGAMLLVMALDGAGYLLAVDHVDHEQAALVAALEDIFVAVALLTVSVGLVLPGMIAHAAEEVARAADHLATGTLADLVRAIQALGVGDLDAAHARVDVVPVVVHTRDELGAMAASFNIMQDNVASAAIALDGAREGLRHARNDLEASHTTLRASEERNRLALQATRMGTWDWDVINDVHTWSTEAEALCGLAPGTFDGTFAAFRRVVHPDDWSAIEIEERTAQAERRDSLTTYRTLWPDGSVRWLESRGRALYTAEGTCARVTGTNLDITERKRAEEALQASEERFRKQYKGFPLPTTSWRKEGDDFVVQDFNDAAEAIGGDVGGWIGSRASARFAGFPEVLADLHACVDEQRTLRRESTYRYRPTDRPQNLVFTFVFVPPQMVMLHSEDITAAKQAEQQREAMAQSEKLRALGQMASGIAHDLNQSLMLVASYSELARQALVQDPPNLTELENLLTTTTQAALDGGQTVKRLLVFTRAAPDQDGERVDLSKVVRDAAQLTAPRWRDAAQAEGRPISLHVEAVGCPAIQGSPSQLRELMTNLIFNAVDALPTGGSIRLKVAADNGQGIVEVVDSGVGMSDEVQARVFEPFFTTKGERGTGLGLAMVFGIVEQHGGRIEVHSTPGAGTTFRMTFPLTDVPSAAAEPFPQPSVPLEPPRPLRVLAVDDEPMMTKAVVRMLRPAGHVVSVAASGEEALEKLAEQTFDVVVSDMGMGAGMNGWELADAVRHRWPSVRFMLATGWGAAIDPGEARAKGVEAVLAKPYHPVDLLQALARSDVAA